MPVKWASKVGDKQLTWNKGHLYGFIETTNKWTGIFDGLAIANSYILYIARSFANIYTGEFNYQMVIWFGGE